MNTFKVNLSKLMKCDRILFESFSILLLVMDIFWYFCELTQFKLFDKVLW